MRNIKFRAWDGIRMTTSGIMFNSTSGTLFTAAKMPIITTKANSEKSNP